MAYFEPDGKPVDLQTTSESRSINMRFATQADLDDFVKKTGIEVTAKTKAYKYRPDVSLEAFFG